MKSRIKFSWSRFFQSFLDISPFFGRIIGVYARDGIGADYESIE